jgi:hypothetical protein
MSDEVTPNALMDAEDLAACQARGPAPEKWHSDAWRCRVCGCGWRQFRTGACEWCGAFEPELHAWSTKSKS